jgi:DNA replication protein DnaC
MSGMTASTLDGATVEQYCRQLRLPSVAAQYERLAKEAALSNQTHTRYLAELLGLEVEDRERRTIERRLREARLPRLKTLEEFDFQAAPAVPAVRLRELAEGGYIEHREPVIFLGDSGTGKTHLATGLCVAACRQKRRCRFITAASLVNELIEAQHHNLLGRMIERWSRYELIVLDEVGYVPFAQVGAELLFQVISERAERATLIITTNLPFSEWTQVLPNARLCKALLDRVTDRAHIIETGTESYRFRRTMESRKRRGKKSADA